MSVQPIKSKRLCSDTNNFLKTKLRLKPTDLEKSVIARMVPDGKFLYTINISVEDKIKQNGEIDKQVSLFVKCMDTDGRPNSNKWQSYTILKAMVRSHNMQHIRNDFFEFSDETPEHGWSDFLDFSRIQDYVELGIVTIIITIIIIPVTRTPLTLKALCGNKIIEQLGNTEHAKYIPTLNLPRELENYLTLESKEKLREKKEVKQIVNSSGYQV